MPGDERLHTVGTGRELRAPLIIKCQNSYSKFKCCLTLAMAMALRMCLAGRRRLGVESGRLRRVVKVPQAVWQKVEWILQRVKPKAMAKAKTKFPNRFACVAHYLRTISAFQWR
ncbi:uncharacterized protein LOC117901826 [Drosophila subobscura]|uniref:uncharacterized protein LOC117901826 n=1 Tax=Drosophila subobscura TaxID=7241 RepID=UPI00155AB218|nr:uncharacterized protein LOC117901826 [Drosophila subobscura]